MTAPIAQYLFKNNLNDETGNYNGTAYTTNSTLSYEEPPEGMNLKGKVLVAKGTRHKFYIPSIPSILGVTPWSFECWCLPTKLNYDTQWMCLFANQNNPQIYWNIKWYPSQRANPPFLWGNKGVFFGDVIKTGSWLHLVLTCQDATTSTAQMYLNGQVLSKNVVSAGSYGGFGAGIIKIGLGFEFKMANYRIYDQVLTAPEILQHYQAESSPPPSPFSRCTAYDVAEMTW